MTTDWQKWRGLKALVQDAVAGGSTAIERVQKRIAGRTFTILEAIPGVAEPTRVVHAVHDAIVTGVHASIRVTTEVIGAGLDAVLEAVEKKG